LSKPDRIDSFIGLEWTPKLEASIHRDHLREINLYKAKDSLFKLKRGEPLDRLAGSLSESMVVAVLKSKDDPSIVGLGVNCVDDLFTNNFAAWLAMQFQTPNQSAYGTLDNRMRDINGNWIQTGAAYGNMIYSSGYYWDQGWWNCYFNYNQVGGMQFLFGSGSTVATRADYKIQTFLGNAPESGRFDCGFGSYAGGGVSSASSICAGGSGNVREVGLIGVFNAQSGPYYFLLTHDIFNANVSYIAGNILLASLLIQI
jgi:hypothetical protein